MRLSGKNESHWFKITSSGASWLACDQRCILNLISDFERKDVPWLSRGSGDPTRRNLACASVSQSFPCRLLLDLPSDAESFEMILKLVLVIVLLQAALAIPFPSESSHNTSVNQDSLPLLGPDPGDSSPVASQETHGTKDTSKSTGEDGQYSGLPVTGGLILSTGGTSPSMTAPTTSHSTAVRTTSAASSQQEIPSASTTSATSTSNVSPTGSSAPSTSSAADAGYKIWKVVGVAVIVIFAVALVIVTVVFFDRWKDFLCDVIMGRKRSHGNEDLVPDWEKGSWEFSTGDNSLEPTPKHQRWPPEGTVLSGLKRNKSEIMHQHSGPVPVFVNFQAPPNNQEGHMRNLAYSATSPAALSRQNSRATHNDAYTAYA